MKKTGYYIFYDLIRNRAIVGLTFLLVAVGWGSFLLESQPEKSLLILTQVTLYFIPLVCLIFSSMNYYNSLEFTLLLLSQPISRSVVFKNMFLALSLSFAGSYIIGLGIPVFAYYPSVTALFLLAGGLFLIFIHTGIALLISVYISDKARGTGIALLFWAFFAFFYDGLLILGMYQWGDYPIEKAVLILSFFNPVDISRILIMMKTDNAALLGLSGAVFRDFFGGLLGIVISFAGLLIWIIIPILLSRKRFLSKDM